MKWISVLPIVLATTVSVHSAPNSMADLSNTSPTTEHLQATEKSMKISWTSETSFALSNVDHQLVYGDIDQGIIWASDIFDALNINDPQNIGTIANDLSPDGKHIIVHGRANQSFFALKYNLQGDLIDSQLHRNQADYQYLGTNHSGIVVGKSESPIQQADYFEKIIQLPWDDTAKLILELKPNTFAKTHGQFIYTQTNESTEAAIFNLNGKLLHSIDSIPSSIYLTDGGRLAILNSTKTRLDILSNDGKVAAANTFGETELSQTKKHLNKGAVTPASS